MLRRQEAANDGFQAGVLVEDEIVGMVGFHSVNWPHGSTSIGYWLDEGHQGRGLMTRAVRTLVDHAFGVWGSPPRGNPGRGGQSPQPR